jgi:hypothetical protein
LSERKRMLVSFSEKKWLFQDYGVEKRDIISWL